MSIYGMILLGFLFLFVMFAGMVLWFFKNRKLQVTDHKLWDGDSHPGPLDKS